MLYTFWHISSPYSANQTREMTKFKALCSLLATRTLFGLAMHSFPTHGRVRGGGMNAAKRGGSARGDENAARFACAPNSFPIYTLLNVFSHDSLWIARFLHNSHHTSVLSVTVSVRVGIIWITRQVLCACSSVMTAPHGLRVRERECLCIILLVL